MGLCAGLFRYVPYVGPLAAAALPVLVSFTTSTGWGPVIAVGCLFVVMELILNNIIEPWLYGTRLGVSEIGLILATVALFFGFEVVDCAKADVATTAASRSMPLRGAAAAAVSDLRGDVTVTFDDAVTFALLGPAGRASGLDRDVRLDEPYLAYNDLRDLLTYPRHVDGDIPARYAAFSDQLAVSAQLMQACVDRLQALTGPVSISLPKVVRVPEGTHVSRVEGPLGQAGCVLVSTGDKTPWRIKMRAPSFATAQALGPALVGTRMTMLADAVMSFFIAVGDIDR
jgi:hypothetical protein